MLNKTILAASAAFALTLPLGAQETPTADASQEPATQGEVSKGLQTLLKNVPKVLDQKWTTSMKFTVSEGESNNAEIKVGLKYQDMRHFSADVKFRATEGEGEAASVEEGTVQVVCDGTYVYIDGTGLEANMPFPLPIKCKLDVLQQGVMMSLPGGGMDPEGGKADLKSAVHDGLKQAFGQVKFTEEGSTDEMRRFVIANEDVNGWITFGKNFWLPTGMQMEGEGNVMKMSSENSKLVDAFPEGTFTFTVAEGKSVFDLTPMLEGQMGGPAASDEDLEF